MSAGRQGGQNKHVSSTHRISGRRKLQNAYETAMKLHTTPQESTTIPKIYIMKRRFNGDKD